MSDAPARKDADMLDRISLGSKEFYSAGATFSVLTCAAVVVIVWGALGDIYSPFRSRLCALALSFMLVFAYALLIPEPHGYPNAGKFRITISEMLFGFINSLIVFSSAVGLERL